MTSKSKDALAEYLTEQELIKLAGVSRRTLQLWRQRRYGPPWVKLGRNLVL